MKKFINKIGRIEFFCFIAILIIMVNGVYSTALTPNKVEITMKDNSTGELYNETKVRYLVNDDVPERSFTWGEFGLVAALIGIVILIRFQKPDDERDEWNIIEVETMIDKYLQYKIMTGDVARNTKRITGAKRKSQSYVNEETGVSTKAEPFKWVAKVEEKGDSGNLIRYYKVGITAFKNQVGVDEFSPILDDQLDISKEPTITKIIKTKEEFEKITSTEKSQRKPFSQK